MDLKLNGRTALVLGGSKGIGRGIAEALAAEGVAVALVARNADQVRAAADAIAAAHGTAAFGFSADLANWTSIERAIDAARSALGGDPDILVNNSGGPPPSGVAGIDPGLWSAQFDAMVLSLIRIADAVLPGMRTRQWGRILTVASSLVVEPSPMIGVSAALRSTLVGWSKVLASEVAADGITVNMLLPGLIATDRTAFLDRMAAEKTGRTVAEVEAQRTAAIPVGRYGTPAEFGAVAAFLASDAAAYVTGSMIRIDGGAMRSV